MMRAVPGSHGRFRAASKSKALHKEGAGWRLLSNAPQDGSGETFLILEQRNNLSRFPLKVTDV